MTAPSLIAAFAALTLGVAGTAHSQDALTDNVQPPQKVIVTERSGTQSKGRVLRVSTSELVLMIEGREQVIPSRDIRRIERGDSVWNGVVLGAVPFALLGGAAAGASCSPHCGRDIPAGMLVFGAIGSALGALIDSRIRGYTIVDGPTLASPNARRSPVPVTTIEQLWQRVRSGDRITIETRSGPTVTGAFVQAQSGFVALTVDGVRQEIPSSEVRRVTRSGNRHRAGARWGAGIAATFSVAAAASCGGEGCGNPLFAGALGAGVGALWGTLIGAAIPQHPVVFGAAGTPTTRLMPIVGSSRVGAAFSVAF